MRFSTDRISVLVLARKIDTLLCKSSYKTREDIPSIFFVSFICSNPLCPRMICFTALSYISRPVFQTRGKQVEYKPFYSPFRYLSFFFFFFLFASLITLSTGLSVFCLSLNRLKRIINEQEEKLCQLKWKDCSDIIAVWLSLSHSLLENIFHAKNIVPDSNDEPE